MNTYSTREVSEKFGYNYRVWLRKVMNGTAPVTPIPGTKRYSKVLVDFVIEGTAQVEVIKAEVAK
ncbi:MAG TPA: hypothetical protein DEG43_03650 [Acidimicrobiaceae bacterium]|nr:hypothetical protein [Acidimicrobiaceae bacterium]